MQLAWQRPHDSLSCPDCVPVFGAAQAVAGSLPGELQAELDSYDGDKAISSSRSYGRYLENAVWALDALKPINNVTTLKAGTYTGQVTSDSSMGKADSRRGIKFTITSVRVEGGRAFARDARDQ